MLAAMFVVLSGIRGTFFSRFFCFFFRFDRVDTRCGSAFFADALLLDFDDFDFAGVGLSVFASTVGAMVTPASRAIMTSRRDMTSNLSDRLPAWTWKST